MDYSYAVAVLFHLLFISCSVDLDCLQKCSHFDEVCLRSCDLAKILNIRSIAKASFLLVCVHSSILRFCRTAESWLISTFDGYRQSGTKVFPDTQAPYRGSAHGQRRPSSPPANSPSSSSEGNKGACTGLTGGSEGFTYRTCEKDTDRGLSRLITVECPGVDATGVEIEHFLNGCVISLNRPQSDNVKEMSWTKTFYFDASNGTFEFDEDQAVLENGVLKVAFVHSRRIFWFPNHCSRVPTEMDCSPSDDRGRLGKSFTIGSRVGSSSIGSVSSWEKGLISASAEADSDSPP
eukprot:TRINITY_DN13650_c0_g1_i1.p1 TRINITY_DN13650_c0_g1~~TRINITY_DN13650_c0_g1_i1.p1  ORF type:complete len:292 (+),score=24.08 TRINITY_DN13650_c0_g1_i1:61-936(+)